MSVRLSCLVVERMPNYVALQLDVLLHDCEKPSERGKMTRKPIIIVIIIVIIIFCFRFVVCHTLYSRWFVKFNRWIFVSALFSV